MDEFLNRLESQFSAFVTCISHFESISDFPAEFETLDKELVAQVAELRQHYSACKRKEILKQEGEILDQKVNSILIELAQFREELESSPSSAPVPEDNVAVNTQDLLDYSSKITRFTKRLPGSAEVGILPWPAEDQLRRGMLATLTIQEENAPFEESVGVQDQDSSSFAPTEMARPTTITTTDKVDETNLTEHKSTVPSSNERPRAKPKPKPKISLDLDSDDD